MAKLWFPPWTRKPFQPLLHIWPCFASVTQRGLQSSKQGTSLLLGVREGRGESLAESSKESESEVTQSYLILCDPMDYSLSGSSVQGIFQARVLEWVAISFSRGSSQPKENLGLPNYRHTLYRLSHQGKAKILLGSKDLLTKETTRYTQINNFQIFIEDYLT